MQTKEVFLRLEKIDPFQGIATGVAAAEELDRENEILDYEGSKPFFQAWSDSVKKDSGGKSLGNVRFQHDDKRPVGKLLDMKFDDAKKQIRVAAKIVETDSLNMLREGVLTGFSIGGSYAKKTPLPNGATRYIAVPAEISVCDRPCAPSAVFASVKADGSIELKKFAPKLTRTLQTLDAVGKALKFIEMGFNLATAAELTGMSTGALQMRLYSLKKHAGKLLERDWRFDSIEEGEFRKKAKPRINPNQAIATEDSTAAAARITTIVQTAVDNALLQAPKTTSKRYQNLWERQLDGLQKNSC